MADRQLSNKSLRKNFGELLLICQICLSFLLSKFSSIQVPIKMGKRFFLHILQNNYFTNCVAIVLFIHIASLGKQFIHAYKSFFFKVLQKITGDS